MSAQIPQQPSDSVVFYSWPQDLARTILTSILKSHLPHSNPLYNRILAPQNTPSRHCLFAATFPPYTSAKPLNPATFTILFSDRSRHHEAQIWIFNPLIEVESLDADQTQTLGSHIYSALHFLRNTPITAAPGWPFSSILRFACVQTHIAEALNAIAAPFGAVKHDTNWTHYVVPLSGKHSAAPLPDGFRTSSVPDDQLDLVISTSGIPRQAETLRSLPSSAVLDPMGKLVAWSYMDIDGSLATLYVVPEHRNKGLAKAVASNLLEKLHKGEFEGLNSREGVNEEKKEKDLLPFGQGSGWVHVEVKEGNRGSEKVVEGLGGRRIGMSRYVFVDCALIP